MNRRRFLAFLAGAGLVPSYGAPASGLERSLAQGICRSPVRRASAVAVEPPATPLSFAGTRLVKDGFMDDIAAAYTAATGNPVRVLGGGCDDAIETVGQGRSHLGGLCCRPAAGTPTDGFHVLTVAQDVKVILAHRWVTVDSITTDELLRMGRGEITNWRILGGPDRPLPLVVYDHCPAYAEPVREALLKGDAAWSPHALRAKTDQELLDLVERFPWSVGVNSWVLAQPLVRAGRLKALALDGIPPALDGRPQANYPLKGPLSLAYAGWQEETMRPFLDFVFSAEGRAITAERALPLTASEAGYAAT